MVGSGTQLSRAAVLGYRALAHDLERPARSRARRGALEGGVLDVGVLEVGVQDTPAGATAGPALRARLNYFGDPDPARSPGLVLVHSLRGAMHVHRAGDLGLLVAALRPDEAAAAAALDQVADALGQVMADGESRTKGELSTALTRLLPSRLRPWCPTCAVEHAPDGLFRAATLPAGLYLQPVGHRGARFLAAAPPAAGDRAEARRELLRRYLRRCGPATYRDLAAWAGLEPPAARSWWELLAEEFVEVRVDGTRLWMHAGDLSAARGAAAPSAVRLLPPYDPLVEVGHRELLLPDAAHRRQVWRAVANPGVVLIAGEITGTWRRRQRVLTVSPFRPLSAPEQGQIGSAAAVMDATPAEVVFAA